MDCFHEFSLLLFRAQTLFLKVFPCLTCRGFETWILCVCVYYPIISTYESYTSGSPLYLFFHSQCSFIKSEKKRNTEHYFHVYCLTFLINLYTLTLSWQGRLLAQAGDYTAAADIFQKILELWYALDADFLFRQTSQNLSWLTGSSC